MSDPGPAASTGRSGSPVFASGSWSPRSATWIVTFTFLMSVLGSLAIREVLARDLSDSATAILAGGVLTFSYLVDLAVVRALASSGGTSFASAVGLVRPQGRVRGWVAVAMGGALAARAFAAVYGLLVDRLGLHIPGANSGPLYAFPGSGISVVVLVAVVVFIAPFAEEVVFRGVVLPAMGARWGTIAGLVVSSILFAAFHVSVYLFLPIVVAAFIFGGVSIRFRSLWPAYLAHATFNAAAAAAVIILKGRGLA